jgi:hypothetical protein
VNYIKENYKEFEVCNIPLWHEKGYTGKGIKFAELEEANPDTWFFNGKLKDPFGECIDTDYNTHGQKVFDVFLQVAPDAEIYSLPNGGYYSSRYAKGDLVEKSIPYAIEEGIHIMGASLKGNDNDILNKTILDAQKHGIVFTTSAGNEGERGLGGYARSDVWISVGALGLYGKNFKSNIPYFLKNYSSRGKELDVVAFSGLYVRDGRSKYKDRVFQVEGTSFSHPMFAGMLALVQQFFMEKIGRTLYQDEAMLFIQNHVVDLGEPGHDELYGYGLFVLPNPDAINPYKYIKKKVIEMQIGSLVFTVNGIKKIMDTAPFIKSDRTFVPIRFIAENLDCTASWDDSERKVTIETLDKRVILFIGKKEFYVNDRVKQMDVAPFISQNRTFVPIRWIAENFDAEVHWYEKERKIKIIKN